MRGRRCVLEGLSRPGADNVQIVMIESIGLDCACVLRTNAGAVLSLVAACSFCLVLSTSPLTCSAHAAGCTHATLNSFDSDACSYKARRTPLRDEGRLRAEWLAFSPARL
eukprot:3821694-Pleurochrysis_carterae.AAC.3